MPQKWGNLTFLWIPLCGYPSWSCPIIWGLTGKCVCVCNSHILFFLELQCQRYYLRTSKFGFGIYFQITLHQNYLWFRYLIQPSNYVRQSGWLLKLMVQIYNYITSRIASACVFGISLGFCQTSQNVSELMQCNFIYVASVWLTSNFGCAFSKLYDPAPWTT